MRIKKLLTIISFLVITSLHAQKQQNAELKRYYTLTHEANIAVCKGDFVLAAKKFRDAFSSFQHPFLIDINNAIYAEVRKQKCDTSVVYDLLAKMQKKGICVHDHFKNIPSYQFFLNNTDERLCNKVTDTMSRKVVNDCIDRDQVLRKFSEEQFYDAYDPSVLKAINALDSFNYFALSSLLDSLSQQARTLEDVIGHKATLDLFTIFQHNSSWSRFNSDQLTSLVKKGFLDARETAQILDLFCFSQNLIDGTDSSRLRLGCNRMTGIYGSSLATIFSKQVLIAKIGQEDLYEMVKSSRDNIFLGDVYENARIVAYAHYNGSNGFTYPGIMELPDEYSERVINNLSKAHKPFVLYKSGQDYDFSRKW